MIKNYLKIAFRSLWRNKLYTSINMLGLTLSLVGVILLAVYILDELTFDRFHSNSDRIFRITETKTSPNQSGQTLAAVGFKVAPEAKQQFPEIEEGVAMVGMGRIHLTYEENESESYEEFTLVHPEFLQKIFDFDFKYGDRATALTEPNTVVISSELAEKLFGQVNPVGEMVQTDRELNLTIDGVLEPVPSNSHLKAPIYASVNTLQRFDWFEEIQQTDWTSSFWHSYVLLKEDSDPIAVGQKLTSLVNENRGEEEAKGIFTLQPLKDIHFYSEGFGADINAGKSKISHIYLFGTIAIFILLIACINYMNLVTARSSLYAKEVGVRKVVGARRMSLIHRFFTESFILSVLSFLTALLVAQLTLPFFNTFIDKTLDLNLTDNVILFSVLFALVILMSLLAGGYPSLYLSRFNPVVVLRGKLKKGREGISLRRALVVFQFVLSTVLIIGTVVAFSQMDFINKKDLGFNEDQLMVIDINSGETRKGFQAIKEGYAAHPAVKSVSVSSRVPGEWKAIPQVKIQKAGEAVEDVPQAYFIGGDEDFLETFDIDLLEGRNFDASRPADSTALLINETGARLLGLRNSGETKVTIPTRSFSGSEQTLDEPFQAKIIGIVKDFHFQSLHEEIRPMVIGYRNNPVHSIDYFTVRLTGNNTEEAIAGLTDILHSVDPNQLFEYHFLDEQLRLFYEEDQRRGQIFTAAALFAIFIACLGLFGLAAFTAEQRTKEVGIRKILGASVSNLVLLLSKEFMALVGMAFVVAIPIGWYASSRWLEGFAYTIELQWWMFALPGVIALLVALLTVSFQSFKTAKSNPVRALRYE